jgi:hypothetical protein
MTEHALQQAQTAEKDALVANHEADAIRELAERKQAAANDALRKVEMARDEEAKRRAAEAAARAGKQ